MKLSLSTLACPQWPLDRIISACTAHGIGGIEFRGLGDEIDITRTAAFTTSLADTMAAIQGHGLQLPCFATSVTLVSPSPLRWQDMLDEAHRYAALAQRTGTPLLRIFGGAVPSGMSPDEALAMAQRHLRQIVKICRAHSVLPLIETHDAWATAAAARTLLHEHSSDDVGILWDVECTSRAGAAPPDLVAELGTLIRHVHIKDSVCRNGKNHPRLLGEGDLPLLQVLDALHSLNYQGWVSLEIEKRWHAEDAPGPELSIPGFAQFMRPHI